MMFLKKNELALVNGGYMVQKSDNKPVYHKGFWEAQREAYILSLIAEKVSKADFNGKKADTIEDILKMVSDQVNSEKEVEYTDPVESPATPTIDKLQKEALSWLNHQPDKELNEQINSEMQKFNIINEFEKFGLYFGEGNIVKLNKIYTVSEILEFVKIVQPHLN